MKIDERFKKQKNKKVKNDDNDSIKNTVLQNAILKISLGKPLTLQETVEYTSLTIGFVHMIPKIVKFLK